MNYLKYYFAIVSKAAGRTDGILYDKHHIIPRGIGGPDIETNWIYLTPKEHLVAHHLLAKAYPDVEKLQSGFNVSNFKTYDCYRYMLRLKDIANVLEETKRKQECIDKIKILCNEVTRLGIEKVQVTKHNGKKIKNKKSKVETE